MHLEGVESGGAGPKRFWYSTLDVDRSGNGFQGGFAGSETIQNPCGSFPPMVTCMVSAGWIRAYRVSPVATVPTPPGPPTVLPPVPKATASPSATPPPTERAGPTPSAIPSPTPRTPPPVPLYLPVTWLDA